MSLEGKTLNLLYQILSYLKYMENKKGVKINPHLLTNFWVFLEVQSVQYLITLIFQKQILDGLL